MVICQAIILGTVYIWYNEKLHIPPNIMAFIFMKDKSSTGKTATAATTYGISENGEMRHFWSYNGSDDLSGVNSHPHPQSVFALMKDVELACLVSNQNQSCNFWLPPRVIHEWRHVYVCQAFVI